MSAAPPLTRRGLRRALAGAVLVLVGPALAAVATRGSAGTAVPTMSMTPLPTLPALPVGPVIVAGPGATTSTYATPLVAVSVSGTLTFANLDVDAHDVWSKAMRPDGAPLLRSTRVSTGGTAQVSGLSNLTPGATYVFYCSLHPVMQGTLVALP